MRAYLVWLLIVLVVPGQIALGHDGMGGLAVDPGLSPEAIALGEGGLLESGVALGFAANPAMLPLQVQLEIGAGHAGLAENLSASITSAAVAFPIGRPLEFPGQDLRVHRCGAGLSVDHRSYELAQGSAWSSQTVAVGIGCALSTYGSVGILSKFLFTSSDLEDVGARAYGLDLGGRLEVGSRIRLATVIRNIVGSVHWEDGQDERSPLLIGLGARLVYPRSVQTDFNLTYSDNNGTRFGLGIEVPIARTGLCVRGGYVYYPGDYSRSVPTLGFGIQIRRYRLDYAARIDDENAFGTTHHVGLGLDLG
jgi:hypothetical protein